MRPILSWARCCAVPLTVSLRAARSRKRGTPQSRRMRACPIGPGLSRYASHARMHSSYAPLLRRHAHRLRMRVRRVLIDAPLDLGPEVAQEALHGPCGAVAEGADRVALDLLRHLEQHVDLALVGAALRHAGEHAPHPAHALAARRALAAALVLVEVG